MIPTQGKMTPPATSLKKSLLHWDGPHISSHKSPVLFWVWRAEWAGRGEAGGGERGSPALLGLPGELGIRPSPSPPFKTNLTFVFKIIFKKYK